MANKRQQYIPQIATQTFSSCLPFCSQLVSHHGFTCLFSSKEILKVLKEFLNFLKKEIACLSPTIPPLDTLLEHMTDVHTGHPAGHSRSNHGQNPNSRGTQSATHTRKRLLFHPCSRLISERLVFLYYHTHNANGNQKALQNKLL